MVDLLGLTKINEDCRQEARLVFKQNYSQKIFTLANREDENPINDFDNYTSIQIYGVLIKEILNTFGDLITNVHVTDNAKEQQTREIIKFINEKFSKTLKYLEFDTYKVFSELKNTFSNTEELLIGSSRMSAVDVEKSKKMNEIFPNLTKFAVYFDMNPINWDFINGHFVSLVVLDFHSLPFLTHGPQIVKFSKQNPQIKELKLLDPDQSSLNEIKKALPNLEKLEIVVEHTF